MGGIFVALALGVAFVLGWKCGQHNALCFMADKLAVVREESESLVAQLRAK